MCDYSLAGLENRLAKEGEELIVHRFSTGSKGLASPEYLKSQSNGRKSKMRGFFRQKALMRECAVCIPDGAKLQIKNEVVTFRQLTEMATTYRDVLQFSDGNVVSLQQIEEGSIVKVLRLCSEEEFSRNEALATVYG